MDRKRLETMLPNFLRDNEDIPRRVREAREAGDYLAVQGWVHKIAGAYLYLGADTLRARARALQDTLGDEGIAPAEEIEAFCNGLQAVLDAIRRVL